MPRKPKRIGSGDKFKMLATTKIHGRPPRRGASKKSGSHNTKQYEKARNERRKAQRRIKRMQGQLGEVTTQEARNRIQGRIDELQRAIENTRMYSSETGKHVRDKQEVAANVELLSRLNQQRSSRVGSRKAENLVTQVQLNLASVKDKASKYSEAQVHIFYRETMKYWAGVTDTGKSRKGQLGERNKAILKYGGYETLEEAVEAELEKALGKKISWALEVINNPDNYTDEEKIDAFNIIKDNEDELQVSPPSSPMADVPDYAPNN